MSLSPPELSSDPRRSVSPLRRSCRARPSPRRPAGPSRHRWVSNRNTRRGAGTTLVPAFDSFDIAEVATGQQPVELPNPRRWRALEARKTAAHGTHFRMFGKDRQGSGQVLRMELVVVVYQHDDLALGLRQASAARGSSSFGSRIKRPLVGQLAPKAAGETGGEEALSITSASQLDAGSVCARSAASDRPKRPASGLWVGTTTVSFTEMSATRPLDHEHRVHPHATGKSRKGAFEQANECNHHTSHPPLGDEPLLECSADGAPDAELRGMPASDFRTNQAWLWGWK